MKNSKLIVLCMYLLFSGCKENGNSNLNTELIVPNRIDRAIKERIQNGFENKVYLAKINLNEPVQYKFYGGLGDSKTINDRFEFGSITKTFTSLLIYKLHKKDLISYEDKIIKYLPDSLINTPNIAQIKIKHLLNHTSGLPWFPENYEVTAKPWNNPFLNFEVNDLMKYVKDFNFSQKRAFQYSNMGYGLLTYIIEKITNQTLKECIDKEILEELKTNWNLTDNRTVQGYDWNSEFNNWDFPSINFGVGGLRGSIDNIATYGEYMLQLMAEDKEYLNLIFSDTIKFEQPFYYLAGRGWYKKINQKNKKEFIFHGGWTGGFNSEIILDIQKKEGLVILSNTSSFIDDLAINYFDSTFDIRFSNKDFSWLLVDELKKGVDIQNGLNSIDKKQLNVNRLLELSRYFSDKDLKNSLAINEFIIKLDPTNWIAIFEQGKYYVLMEKYDKAKISFDKAIKVGGNIPIVESQLEKLKRKIQEKRD